MSGGARRRRSIALANSLPLLDRETEAALRSSIARHGVLVPVMHDQHGRTLDGRHREHLAAELGVPVPVETVEVRDDEHALALAVELNLVRRQLSPEERRLVVASLRAEGHSTRAIAGALGVSQKTVWQDGQDAPVTHVTAARVRGQDGKSYPARRRQKRRKPSPSKQERPLFLRFVDALGTMSHLLEQPDALRAAIPPTERDQWASELRSLSTRAADAAGRLTGGSVDEEWS